MAKAPRAPDEEIECVTLHGGRSRHPAREFRFRPAAYGIALRDGLVLLGRSAFSGKWDFPGGGVEAWETMEQGLRREFREETGRAPENPRLFRVLEGFFSIYGRAYHSLRFYYLVDLPVTAAGSADDAGEFRPDPDELTYLGWRRPEECRREDCTAGVWELLQELRAR